MPLWLGIAFLDRPLVTLYLRSQTLRPLSTVAPSHDEDLWEESRMILGSMTVTEKCAFKHSILPYRSTSPPRPLPKHSFKDLPRNHTSGAQTAQSWKWLNKVTIQPQLLNVTATMTASKCQLPYFAMGKSAPRRDCSQWPCGPQGFL